MTNRFGDDGWTLQPTVEWIECFPVQDVENILRYVVESWDDLRKSFPVVHGMRQTEPTLTKSLSEWLDDSKRRRNYNVGGRFVCERPICFRGALGRLRQRARTDIEYHLPASGAAILVIEFKKLFDQKKQNRWRKEYVENGIKRFIDGFYASSEECAVMCGFVVQSMTIESQCLQDYLRRRHGKAPFLASTASGSDIDVPSLLAPSVASFDTRHGRISSPGARPIDIVHLLLPIGK